MANNLDISTITGINQVGNSYQRKNPIPLDYYSFFNTRADAEDYAQNGAVSYVGQVIAFKESATDASVKVCVIKNEAGELEALNNVEVKVPGVKQGTYITVTTDANGDYTIAHTNAAQMTVTPEAEKKTTFVTEITRDEQGHITGYKTATVEIPDVSLDEKSIDRTEGEAPVIEIKGFAKAANLTLPQKGTDGEVHWVTIDKAIEGATENTITTGDAGSIDAPTTGSIVHKQIDNGYEVSIKGANTATAGQVLKAKGNGDVEWADDNDTLGKNIVGSKHDSIVNEAVSDGPVYLNHVENNEVVSSIEFVASGNITISADANGQINIADTFTPPVIEVTLNSVEGDAEAGLVDVVQGFDANGHAITGDKVRVATKEYVDRLVTGATDYLGTMDNGNYDDISCHERTGRGDFVRVTEVIEIYQRDEIGNPIFDDEGNPIVIETYHPSDMLICETAPEFDENGNCTKEATWSVIHGEIDANTWVANTKDADGYVAKGQGHKNTVWATNDQEEPGWNVQYEVEAQANTLVLRGTSGEVYGYNGAASDDTTVGQSYIDGYLDENELISAKAIQHLAVLQVSDAEKVYVTDADGKQAQVKYSNSDISKDVIVARGANGAITVPETPNANTDAASKKYVDDAINDGKFTVSGTGYLTGSGEMTANQAGDTTATLDLSTDAKAKIDNAMPKLPEDKRAGAEGHYAIFDATGQVVDGGVINATATVKDTTEDEFGEIGFAISGNNGTEASFTMCVASDSGLAITDANNTECELHLSEATKASLEKANSAVQYVELMELVDPNSVDSGILDTDKQCFTTGFTLRVGKDDTTYQDTVFKLFTEAQDGIVFHPNEYLTGSADEEIFQTGISLADWAKDRILGSVSEVATTANQGLKTTTTYTYYDENQSKEVTTTTEPGIDVVDYTKKTTIDIDESITFILNCGSAADLL